MWRMQWYALNRDRAADARPRVALTFDAEYPEHPQREPSDVEDILAQLSLRQVTATFFLQGRWAETHPDTARRIAAGGHLIGSHSHYHADLRLLSPAGFRADVCRAERAIRHACGVDPHPWFRCPFGAADRRSASLLAALGYRHVGWNVDGGDDRRGHDEGAASAVEADVVRGVVNRSDTAVVRLHAWAGVGRDALPGIIARLRAMDAHFVSIGRVIDDRSPDGNLRRPSAAWSPGWTPTTGRAEPPAG
jgi:peptidoglycan/xylan/chitin deacetylase (PgdA/CDA1 family)